MKRQAKVLRTWEVAVDRRSWDLDTSIRGRLPYRISGPELLRQSSFAYGKRLLKPLIKDGIHTVRMNLMSSNSRYRSKCHESLTRLSSSERRNHLEPTSMTLAC
jgi:hypothetical protein